MFIVDCCDDCACVSLLTASAHTMWIRTNGEKTLMKKGDDAVIQTVATFCKIWEWDCIMGLHLMIDL